LGHFQLHQVDSIELLVAIDKFTKLIEVSRLHAPRLTEYLTS
jgi:hypothetical protein